MAHAQPPPGPLTEGLARVTDAVSLAEEAVALAPRNARAHTTLAVASGRLALYTPDARARVALATRIRLAAEKALALDPAEDVAHHALGRWNFEIASLNPITRLFARTILGGADMARASHAQALHHYAAAAELAPRRLTHRAEMGKALLKMGRRAEALQALRAALACEVEDINALLGRMHAERLIKKLRRQERREQREARRYDSAHRVLSCAADAALRHAGPPCGLPRRRSARSRRRPRRPRPRLRWLRARCVQTSRRRRGRARMTREARAHTARCHRRVADTDTH